MRTSDPSGGIAAELLALDAKVTAGVITVTRTHGYLLLAASRRNASKPRSGPPGPRLQTGDYVRSMNMRMNVSPLAVGASVGSNRPQARRLELGFNGADSLGRIYHQPPYAHYGPALDEIAPLFAAAIGALMKL